MSHVTNILLNEEIRRKTIGTDNAQAFVTEKMGSSKSRGPKGGRGKSRGESQAKKKSEKYFHCGKEGHIKKNCFALKEKKEAKNEQKNNTNTTTTLDNEVVVLASENEECLSVANDRVEWVVDIAASYYATLCKEMFTTYKAGDFETVKIRNTSHSNIVGIGNFCI